MGVRLCVLSATPNGGAICDVGLSSVCVVPQDCLRVKLKQNVTREDCVISDPWCC